MTVLSAPPSNATTQLQEAVMASAASVLYVLLLLPALARNQSIGYAPYLPYSAAGALPGYPSYGFPAGYPAGYPALGFGAGAAPGIPPAYAPAGSLVAGPPFSPAAGGAQSPFGFSGGLGFPAGWPARPLGPLAAALATAYPTLFSALTGPCRSWCRAPNLPLLFPPSNAESETEQRPFPVLRALRSLFRDEEDRTERGPLMRLLFPDV